MRIGIDFGTSNTAAAIYKDKKIHRVDFDGQSYMPTVVFFKEELDDTVVIDLATAKNSEMVDELVRQLTSEDRKMIADREKRRSETIGRYRARITAAKSAADRKSLESRLSDELKEIPFLKPRSADELTRQAQSSVRNRLTNDIMEQRASARGSVETALFGFEALESIAAGAQGRILQSPKSMLGYTLGQGVEDVLRVAVKNILLHVRTRAESQLGTAVTEAVIGRPLKFKCASDAKSAEQTQQALRIIEAAAREAGFESVEFMLEPVAASLLFQSKMRSKKHALVIDIGGGTTDVAQIHLDGDRGDFQQTGSTWGFALGGQDIDTELSLACLMPLFGKKDLDLHKGYLSPMDYGNAARPYNLQRQREFKGRIFDAVPDQRYRARLQTLQEDGNTTRLIRVAEQLKIDLSDQLSSQASLSFIEQRLSASAARTDIEKATESYIRKLSALLLEIRETITPAVELIILTGGMSQSPWVEAVAKSCFPGVKVETRDASFSVVSGLAIQAAR